MNARLTMKPKDSTLLAPAKNGRRNGLLQRYAADEREAGAVPPIVHEVLRSPGQPLDTDTRRFMESRFRHDFSRVRVHTDAKAMESARAVDARAYTVGPSVVFGSNQYAPHTNPGQRLLLHELTHVVQQGAHEPNHSEIEVGPILSGAELEAESNSRFLVSAESDAASKTDSRETTTAGSLLRKKAGKDLGKEDTAPEGKEPENEPSVQVGESTTVIWFRFNSVELRQDAKADSVTHLAVALSRIRRHLTDVGEEGQVVLHGYASSEGAEAHNRKLSQNRADRIKALLISAGIRKDQVIAIGHGPDKQFPGLEWNRRVEVRLDPTVTRISMPPLTITARSPLLERLKRLGEAAKREGGGGEQFKEAIDGFRSALAVRINSQPGPGALDPDLDIILKALLLWSSDPGNKWGEGIWDSKDLAMGAAAYATVPAERYKCNAYVAEVIYQSVGEVFPVYESEEEPGKYFPYRAGDWGNPQVAIPHFDVVSSPKMGDIWALGPHVGIYLGEYARRMLYISARDVLISEKGLFGLKEGIQHVDGVQIKFGAPGGVYRRYKR